MAKIEQRITPMLWFDNQAEEAANYYVSIFKNSKVTNVSRYGDTGPGPKGSVMVAEFELDGQKFTALNGGPRFKFTEAISLVVNCENQEEVDYYWEKLSGDGGQEVVCGWLKDKYGLSWQIVPVKVFELLSDPATSDRVMAAVMEMKKIELSKIEQAAAKKAGA
ncbi:MAG TPA: VOC family protein [Pyrinomonadaceae bacterium]|nr:VOC family protein [Pyrinomonadaceae bacterium]